LIAIDIHEPKSIIKKLQATSIPIETKRLEIGDYTWNNLCIERKTVQDFFSSIYSREPENNLFSQLFQLKQYKIPILIIQGNLFTRYKWYGRKRVLIDENEFTRRIKTAFTILAKLPIRYGIYHYIVQGEAMLVQLIKSLYLNTYNNKAYAPIKRKGKTVEEIKENILTCIPLIGRKRAKLILSVPNTTIQIIANSSVEELVSKYKISQKLASKILECFTS